MAVSPARARLMLAASVVLVLAAGVVVAVGVIPQVLASSAPGIDPKDAVPAFRVTVVLHLLAAVALAFVAMRSKGRSRTTTVVLVATGVAVLLFGFVLADAALAFLEAASSTRAVAVLLLSCIAADVLAGALALTAAFLRPADAAMGDADSTSGPRVA